MLLRHIFVKMNLEIILYQQKGRDQFSCKYLGAFAGCQLSRTDKNVRNYLGLTLLPQAGVSIGMARSSSSVFRELANEQLAINPNFAGADYLFNIGTTITAVVLCATLVYELLGPVITKIALTRAGEIKKEPKKVEATN